MDRIWLAAKLCNLVPAEQPDGMMHAVSYTSVSATFEFKHDTESVSILQHGSRALLTEEEMKAQKKTQHAIVFEFCDVFSCACPDGSMQSLDDGDSRFLSILSKMATFVLGENLVGNVARTSTHIMDSVDSCIPVIPTLDSVCYLLHLVTGGRGRYCERGMYSRQMGEFGTILAKHDTLVVFCDSALAPSRKAKIFFDEGCELDMSTLVFKGWKSFDHAFFYLFFQFILAFPPPGRRYPESARLTDKFLQWLQFQSGRRPRESGLDTSSRSP